MAQARAGTLVEKASVVSTTSIPAHRRDQLERLLRYTARGAVALERLEVNADGDLLYTFTHPWSDGTTGITLSPLELLEKLAALVPLPRLHQVRYGGCLAPHSRLRVAIIPTPRQQGLEAPDDRSLRRTGRGHGCSSASSRLTWNAPRCHPASGSQLETRQTLDYQPGPGVCAKKNRRDRLMRLARGCPTLALGFQDEGWWSRLAQPSLHAWTEDKPLRLVEKAAPKADTDRKALACSSLFLPQTDTMLLRFVNGRPVSHVTWTILPGSPTVWSRTGSKR
jgi:hypothetical protein